MKKILLLSDTHAYIDQPILNHISQCDEVWHAGDIGSLSVISAIEQIKPVIGVFGNIDSQDIRATFPKEQIFHCEGFKVFITHIGGYPNRYAPGIKKQLIQIKPDIFICGHSHILKVIYDKQLNILHLNPGAAGIYGAQKVRTMLSFNLNNGKISDMKIIEIPLKKVL